MGKMRRALICLPLLALASACVRLQVEPIRIEPIYIEMTINHRIQRDLDSFFLPIWTGLPRLWITNRWKNGSKNNPAL